MAKKNLLVTVADESYIDAVKQVFSGAYFNAGWKGDYMLLSYKIPEEKLKWFRDKGIIVKKCEPLADEKVFGRWLSIVLIRLLLFKSEFKKWNKIIYIDGDTIIRASLDDLQKVEGFAAVWKGRNINSFVKPLKKISNSSYLNKHKLLVNELNTKCDKNSDIFGAGVFALSTNAMEEDTFYELSNLLNKLHPFSRLNLDEFVLNLLFYKKWKKLPFYYNVYVIEPFKIIYKLNLIKIDGIVIHFVEEGILGTNKPWSRNHPFYKEWRFNFDRADEINIKKPYKNFRVFTNSEKKYWQKYYKRLYNLWKIEPLVDYLIIRPFSLILLLIGKIGLFLKNNYPFIYYKLKGDGK